MDIKSPPIVKKFTIIGLHGYKDVIINFEAPAKILISENGVGKTTILYMLYSILSGRFEKIRNVEFEKAICLLNDKKGNEFEIEIDKKTISDSFNFNNSSSFDELLNFCDFDRQTLANFILQEFDPSNTNITQDSIVGREIYSTSPWGWDEIHDLMSSTLVESDENIDGEQHQTRQKIKEVIGDTEILYLPTYRRIEKLLTNTTSRRNGKLNPYIPRRKPNESLPNSSGLNYGLNDVADRLASLTEDVQRRTNLGYREISASIIDDLLAGKADGTLPELSSLPDIETLKLFFSRIGKNRRHEFDYLEKIDDIYHKYTSTETEQSTLIYFLLKLSQVVNQTSKLESTIENFVVKANTYLENTSDSKIFSYNPETMDVSIINKWTGNHVKLNDLSSGEKQIVSLLSYLYLYPSDKIILMDEPELSLSIDWQQRILVDIVDAPTCKQLLAITHSPFVFDNKLDCFATSLNIARNSSKNILI
ncbi:AAA family ATPase [Shewanella algae]|uniref:AAA family ATPase n=1 Tax=Shewanella algae TaxID=38313 RepID=UPI0031F54E9B